MTSQEVGAFLARGEEEGDNQRTKAAAPEGDNQRTMAPAPSGTSLWFEVQEEDPNPRLALALALPYP